MYRLGKRSSFKAIGGNSSIVHSILKRTDLVFVVYVGDSCEMNEFVAKETLRTE